MSITQILQDPNTKWVLIGCVLLGISSGVLGCFAFLRNRSLMGDALAHAALPGVCLIYLLTHSKSIGLFLIGATLAGLVGTYCISAISKYSRIKEDTALALILSVFFGIGIVMLTHIQHSASGNQSGLDKFLFGQAASLVASDVLMMVIVSAVLIGVTILFFKEFKLLSFDQGFGRGLGFPMGFIDGLLMLLLVLAVVIGLQAVGVVLMAAMLITPAVTARYWTDKLATMLILSGAFGAASGILGTLLSTQVTNLPTGPVIVLAATCFFVFSLLFSPKRGLLFRLYRFLQLREKVLLDDVLRALYERLEREVQQKITPKLNGFTCMALAEKSGKSKPQTQKALQALKRQGLVNSANDQYKETLWILSEKGLQEAYQLILNQRLWDVYMMNEQEYQSLSIEKSQEEIVPQLTTEELQQLMQVLETYNILPVLGNNEYTFVLQAAQQGGK